MRHPITNPSSIEPDSEAQGVARSVGHCARSCGAMLSCTFSRSHEMHGGLDLVGKATPLLRA